MSHTKKASDNSKAAINALRHKQQNSQQALRLQLSGCRHPPFQLRVWGASDVVRGHDD